MSEWRPTDAEVEAAARKIHGAGERHGWWRHACPSAQVYDDLDPIGKSEFNSLIEEALIAAHKAK